MSALQLRPVQHPTQHCKCNVRTSVSLLCAPQTHHNTRDKPHTLESHILTSISDQVGGSKLCSIKTHKVIPSLTAKYFPNTHNQQMESTERYNFPIYWIPHVSKCFRFFVSFFYFLSAVWNIFLRCFDVPKIPIEVHSLHIQQCHIYVPS